MLAPQRTPVVAGNWKMHLTVSQALALVRELRSQLAIVRDRVEIILAPPFTALHPVKKAIEDSNLKLAAQNCHFEPQGAFTGEVAPQMLEELGCSHVILGHSERRQLFGETDELVNRKVHAAFKANLKAIICVGETLAEREGGRTLEVVSRQVAGALAGVTASMAAEMILAYEPVWAIGTGKTASSAQAQEVHARIREQLVSLYSRPIAEQVRIQYGGSVKPDNAVELLAQPDIDGALVGGASLKAADFAAIVKAKV